jgi:HD-GYP domain-containing protein (c-di-GMP phosphodiesterase class II)
MNNQNINQDVNNTTDRLSDKVASFREEARTILRMKAIASIMSDVGILKKNIATEQAILDHYKLNIAGIDYDNQKLDTEHPLYKNKVEALKIARTHEEEKATNCQKTIERYEKNLNSLKQDIAKWENGTYKVDLPNINILVNDMINRLI